VVKVTLPSALSLTVAVHVVGSPAVTESGEHATDVVLGGGVPTSSSSLPMLKARHSDQDAHETPERADVVAEPLAHDAAPPVGLLVDTVAPVSSTATQGVPAC
jgi:hypothetical protein